jgi:hypothetical protein
MRRRAPSPQPVGVPAGDLLAEADEPVVIASHQVHAEPGKPNPYPHRMSVDVDRDTYRALRMVAAHEGCRLIDLVRSGIARELKARQ